MNVSKFERFFRVAGGLDVDKTDLKRYSDFVHRKAYDLLLMSQVAAKFNLRDVIEFWDLPITKGLQESIHGFTKLDEQIELEPILEGLTQLPPLDLEYGEETRLRLPSVYGGLSVALARSFKIVDPHLKSPRSATGRHVEISRKSLRFEIGLRHYSCTSPSVVADARLCPTQNTIRV